MGKNKDADVKKQLRWQWDKICLSAEEPSLLVLSLNRVGTKLALSISVHSITQISTVSVIQHRVTHLKCNSILYNNWKPLYLKVHINIQYTLQQWHSIVHLNFVWPARPLNVRFDRFDLTWSIRNAAILSPVDQHQAYAWLLDWIAGSLVIGWLSSDSFISSFDPLCRAVIWSTLCVCARAMHPKIKTILLDTISTRLV